MNQANKRPSGEPTQKAYVELLSKDLGRTKFQICTNIETSCTSMAVMCINLEFIGHLAKL